MTTLVKPKAVLEVDLRSTPMVEINEDIKAYEIRGKGCIIITPTGTVFVEKIRIETVAGKHNKLIRD